MFEETKKNKNTEPKTVDNSVERVDRSGNDSYNTPILNIPEDNAFIPVDSVAGMEEINKNTHYIFFFGTAGVGKSVISSTMLYYLGTKEGVLRPNKEVANDREARVLKSNFFDNLRKGILPERSSRDKVINLNFTFEPDNRSEKVPSVNLTFLEISGEDLREIKGGGRFPEHIDRYLRAKISLSFIIVTSYEEAHREDGLINEFLDELETYDINSKTANIILVISKWDKSGLMRPKNEDELDRFIDKRLPMTSQRMDVNEFGKTYYTVGKVVVNGYEGKVDKLSLESAKNISHWLYESIVGERLDYEGTLWERIKWGITGK